MNNIMMIMEKFIYGFKLCYHSFNDYTGYVFQGYPYEDLFWCYLGRTTEDGELMLEKYGETL